MTGVKNKNKNMIGYFVNRYPSKDKNGITIKHIQKKFCSTKETMESKYTKTINYLNDIRS